MAAPFRVALLGAESTGKTLLAAALAARLREQNHTVTVVDEVLRGWCDARGRTPQAHEQQAIADEQARQVEAATGSQIVLADTTALTIAVYSDLLFNDTRLYPAALAHQRSYGLTLLMGLDIAWVPDGLQRDGPQVRAPVDARFRQALENAAIPYSVVYGQGEARTRHALATLRRALQPAPTGNAAAAWVCGNCGDPACERQLFSRLVKRPAATD